MFHYDKPMGIIDGRKLLNLIRETGVIMDNKLQTTTNKREKKYKNIY